MDHKNIYTRCALFKPETLLDVLDETDICMIVQKQMFGRRYNPTKGFYVDI